MLANQPTAAGTDRRIPRRINTEVMFTSEADFLKADKTFREQVEVQNVPSVGGMGGRRQKAGCAPSERSGSARAFSEGRNIRRAHDLKRSLDDQKAAAEELESAGEQTPAHVRADSGAAAGAQSRAVFHRASIALLEDQHGGGHPDGAGVAARWSASCGICPGAGTVVVMQERCRRRCCRAGLGLLFANNPG